VVQVDVFWAYAIGAGCATAAAASAPPPPTRRLAGDPHFTTTVLYLACAFAPSGIWLLWQFPDWETMYAARTAADLPAWLVAAFAATNVTQGVLGYAVAAAMWRRGHRYLSWLQMPLGYLAMFFVLAYGWDGTGYRRFFSGDPGAFVTSDVALTLYGMGVVLVPLLLWIQATWWDRARRLRFTALILAAVFGLGLGTAVAAAVLLHVLGPLAGAPAAVVLAVAVLHPRGPAGLLARRFGLTARVAAAPEHPTPPGRQPRRDATARPARR
jgi:hypothetical protein